MKYTVSLDYKKSTKNTYVYEETQNPGQPLVFPTIYVQKWVLPDQPQTITVTIED